MIFIDCQESERKVSLSAESKEKLGAQREGVGRYVCSKVKDVTGITVYMMESVCRNCMGQSEKVEKLIVFYLKLGMALPVEQKGLPSLIDLAKKLQARCGNEVVRDQLRKATRVGYKLREVLPMIKELQLS